MVFKKKQPEVVKTYNNGELAEGLAELNEQLDVPPRPPQQQPAQYPQQPAPMPMAAPMIPLPLTLLLKIDEEGKISVLQV